MRIDPMLLEQMLNPHLDPDHGAEPIAQGLPASPGAAHGEAVFDADRAVQRGKDKGHAVILLREETKPEDIHGFFAAKGILTSRGGKTSHAAVVARGMGKPCVAGAEGIEVDVHARTAKMGEVVIKEGDRITIDGSSGKVYLGEIPTIEAEFTGDLETLLGWADGIAVMRVLANADTEVDAKRALRYGAQGIGLCRTERMFNAVDRLPVVIEMIVAESPEQRAAALEKLLPMQRADFQALFEVMAPKPVTIRLLDPPIHEFLPSEQQLLDDLEKLKYLSHSARGMEVLAGSMMLLHDPRQARIEAESMRHLVEPHLVDQAIAKKESILHMVRVLHETNPMLGHRGVRLGITFPEIYDMQLRAIMEAEAACIQKGIQVASKIMVPQVCTIEELRRIKTCVERIRGEVEAETGVTLGFQFGSMIEVVRACMRAASLAAGVDFFSFGTNDLTQATFSFSREDAENKFLPAYHDQSILQHNPFEVLDELGVGRLMELAVNWGRETKPELEVSICGEHGGHPSSIHFCHKIGLNYVSCSAPRVPVARLAAAHAQLLDG
jgi:pyruvate,orthophosphate dikinase